jgi:hypothetical protein
MLAPPTYRLGLAVLASIVLSTATASARDAEARARELNRDAMDEDYLTTQFDSAISKLDRALATCGKDHCSKELVAKIHGNLGVVYSAGVARHEAAVAAFKKMLQLDPTQTPNSAYLTGDVQRAFDEAKAALGPARPTERALAVLIEKPWSEQARHHPVPVYVELPAGMTATRVIVRYKPPGQTEWMELTLQKHEAGWGGYIPCPAVEKNGELVYFTTAFDQNLDRIASAGSAERPRKLQIKTGISGRQPALPQAVPPIACPRPEERLSCESDDDCPGADVCRELACVTREHEGPVDGEDEKRKQSWLSIGFSPDLVVVGQTDDACSPSAQRDGKYSCFFAGGVPFDEDPIASGSSNSLSGGVGPGSMRVLIGFDRVLGQRMTAGIRLGYAFFGYPERKDGKRFMPFHAEARFAYHLLSDPFAVKGVRPYLFGGGGLAEVAARVSTVVVWEDPGRQEKTVDVFQRAGKAFGTLGGGIHYAVSPQAAMVVELGGRVMFPEQAFVIAPKLGFAYGL